MVEDEKQEPATSTSLARPDPITPKVDVGLPNYENFKAYPGVFYFFSFASTSDRLIYAIGFVSACFAALSTSALDLILGYWTSGLVPRDGSATSDSITKRSIFASSVMAGATVWSLSFMSLYFFCFSLASSRTTARIRRAYLSAVLAQDAGYFEEIGPGEVASRMGRDIGLMQTAFGEKLSFFSWSMSCLICGITVSIWSAPRVGAVLFSLLPFGAGMYYLAHLSTSKASARISVTEGKASSFLEQIVTSIRMVKVLQASDALIGVYDKLLRDIQLDGRLVSISTGFSHSTSYFVLFCAYALPFYYGGQQVAYHGLEVGRLLPAYTGMFNALFAIVNILPHISGLLNGARALHRIRIEIERPSRIDYRDESGFSDLDLESKDGGIDIELRNVCFYYPSRGPDQPSLRTVSLTIPKGKVVALVGSSGSGKSTVVALLTRQYALQEPTSAHSNIFVGSHPLASIRLSTLRSCIGLVGQDPQLFSGTILENVAVGLTGTPDELLEDGSNRTTVEALCRHALEKAQALSFVEMLPSGLDERITAGKTGVLSGGQRQRIAVARALVRSPRILIFDEGTSALDSETEQNLMDSVMREQSERHMTVILIAHRLSTVKSADKIIVMGAGQVLEEGTHQELLALKGTYTAMIQRHHGAHNFETASTAFNIDDVTQYSTATPTPVAMSPVDLSRSTSHQLMTVASRASARAKSLDHARNLEEGVLEEKTPPSMTSRAKWARFLRFVNTSFWWIVLGSACACIIGALFPLASWLVGLTVSALSQRNASVVSQDSKRFALWFTILAIGSLFLCLMQAYLLENGSQRIVRTMRRETVCSLVVQEVGFFEGPEATGAGEFTSKVSTDPVTVANTLGMVLGRLLVTLINFGGAVLLGLLLDWKLLLVGCAPLLLLGPAGWAGIHYTAAYFGAIEVSNSAATTLAVEAVDAMRTVSAFGQERRMVESFDKMQRPKNKKHIGLLFKAALCFGASQALIPLVAVVIFFYGGHLLAKQAISISALYGTMEAVILGVYSLISIFTYLQDLSGAAQAFGSLYSWLSRKPLVATLISRGSPPTLGAADDEERSSSDIVFRGVSLVYPSRPDKPALSDISLRIRAGERVAFCGPSGSGKSTLLAVLSRFYEPSRGTITIGGVDIRSVALSDHYSKIALVSQDAVLYQGTISFNLTLGLTREVPESELREACDAARILEFVNSLNGGFNAQLGMKGSSLSGGQRQRLCIARALLRNAPILLLDEATSALDNESEALVQQALDRASVGRTTITVAHRLSTIRTADSIVVVEHGRLVEQGTHEELLRKKGRYMELVEAQL